VFEIDMATCPQCGTPKRLLLAEKPAVIAKILTHLGLPTRVPPQATGHIVEFVQTTYFNGFRFSSQAAIPSSPIPPSTPHKGSPSLAPAFLQEPLRPLGILPARDL